MHMCIMEGEGFPVQYCAYSGKNALDVIRDQPDHCKKCVLIYL